MGGRRVLVVIVILLVLSVAATAGKNNRLEETGFQEVEDTECYRCHLIDGLERFVEPAPSAAGAAVGEPFDFSVRVQNTWLAEILGLEASLDLSHAPSLSFGGAPPPSLDRYRAVLEDITSPTSERTTTVVAEVERGTTGLQITITPDNRDPTLGPTLSLRVFPGQTEPQGRPTFQARAPGPGQNATLRLDAPILLEQPSGHWVLEVATQALDGAALDPGGLANITFSAEVLRDFDTSGETLQYRSVSFLEGEGMGPGQVATFAWPLEAVTEPSPGETVRLRVDITSYFRHISSSPDWGYTFQELEIPVSATPSGASLDASGTTPQATPVATVSTARISEVVGYLSAFLVVASVYTGGMFGKATRRHLNRFFGQARRRVAFHNALSYGIILAAVIHLWLFLWPGLEDRYHWTLGLIWGLPAFLAMAALGVTGALQVPMIRRWGYGSWKWLHFGLAAATIALAIVHVLLDGANTTSLQESMGWQNPFDPGL